MHKTLLGIAIAGIIVSGYLFVLYTSGLPIPCALNGGCDVVRASVYSHAFGIPTPAFGIIFYVLLAVLAEMWHPNATPKLLLAISGTTLIGLAVSAYLTYLEAYVILAWCEWCLCSAVLSVAAFVIVWWPGLFLKTSYEKSF